MQTVLTIAGFDPSSGAGITADLIVFAAHSLFGTSAITAVTVQSTTGVRSTHPVAPEILRETLLCLDADLPPTGIKIGMLANAANVATVCDYIEGLRATSGRTRIPIVLDPVLKASSGRELLDREGLTLLRKRLLPLIDWVTPNVAELAVLTEELVAGREDLPRAAAALQAMSPHIGVFAKGGHLDEAPNDLLLSPTGEQTWLLGTRIYTRATHGTGCALSSAFLSRLVLGDQPAEAAGAAKEYVAKALQTASERGKGSSGLNHLWPLQNVQH
jgi:hydroxymethylpyrimidine/phosphomethylpyrimidine kinase